MCEEIWEKNLKAMEKWYAPFANLIRKKEEEKAVEELEVICETSWDGEKIFRIKKENRWLYLGGKRNAKEPVQMWIERLGELHKYAAVFLFGLGSGMYLKELVKSAEEKVNIIAYEPSFSIFSKMLHEIDLSEEIEERPIAFIVEGINENEFVPVMNKALVYENLEYFKEEIHPNYKEFYGSQLLQHIKSLHQRAENMVVQYNTGKKMSINLAKNVLSNMRYVLEGYHTKKLAEVVPYNGAAILVSAGPSLNKNIQELKKAKNKAFLLAVDTAVKPLLKAGIVPDAFITIDANKPLHLVEEEETDKIPIIAPTCAKHSILDHQKGKKIFYFDGYMIPYHIYTMNQKHFWNVATGGSVACTGFSLLYKMGFNTIILVGQDLAYTGSRSHADGTFQEIMPEEDTKGMLLVKGNYEDKVPTRGDFKIYLDWFHMYVKGVKEHRNVRVVNATEGGAYIEGTELSTLKEIIEEVCHEETDFTGCINRMESEFNPKEHERAISYLHQVPEQFGTISQNAKMLKKAYRKLDRISRSGNLNKEACNRQLKKIKKLTRDCQSKDAYQLIEASMPIAECVIRQEAYFEEESLEADIKEIARKGILYSELLLKCAKLLKEYSEEVLLPLT